MILNFEKPQPQTSRHHKIIHQLEKPCKCETCVKSHALLFNKQDFCLAKLQEYMVYEGLVCLVLPWFYVTTSASNVFKKHN